MKTFSRTLLVAAITLSGTSFAATDGLLDGTSTGTSDVTIIKDNVVQLSNVADLDLGSHNSLTADLTAGDDVCVFNSTAAYRVTVSSANTAFELRDGTEAIPYAVSWADSSATVGPVVYGTALTGQLGDRSSPNCSGGTNARFEVTVGSADFNNAVPGTYSDTLTLLIQPE